MDGLYERLSGVGLAYGPAFRGLRGVWKQGEDLFVEAALPEEVAEDGAGFGLHPALLDTVLHALGLGEADAGTDKALLPFMWSGMTLSAVGASAVRVRLSPRGSGEVALRVADDAGDPVAEVASLVLRPVSVTELSASASATAESLFRLEWVPAPVARSEEPVESAGWAVLG
ncbi:polyketide synthase dehydratase domain-containing protein, partial [Streptomyces sp. NPDC021115]|uniref:polyketide synthase dehydratase domain-containing protein n=1 Tax=Streptomyces sp. NPDC021115 TaxID=3365115 RepID=UPI0037934BF0